MEEVEQQDSHYSATLRHLLARATAMVGADGQELTEEGLHQLYAAIMFNGHRLYGENGEYISHYYDNDNSDNDDSSGDIYATDDSGSLTGEDDDGSDSDMVTASEGQAENMSIDSAEGGL